MTRRPFCAEVSRENDEPLAATASRVDRWLLIEYRGLWGRDALAASGLSDEVKEHVRARAAALRPAKVLFVRRRERRERRGLAVFWGVSREGASALFHDEIGSYEDLLGLDL